MEPQVEMIEQVLNTLEANLNLFDTIKIDGLPAGGGISMEISPGYNKDIYLNKQSSKVIPLLFLCKNKDQIVAFNTLCMIGNYLQGLKVYPKGTSFEWMNAETSSESSLLGKDEDGQYIYSSIIEITIYF